MRVGICDDEAVWRHEAANIVCNYGKKVGIKLEVVCFADWKELEEYQSYPLDVLFMNIVFEYEKEQNNGIDSMFQINEKWKDCQIVYLTDFLYFASEAFRKEHTFYVLKAQFGDWIEEIFGKIFHELSQTRNKLIFSVIGGKEVSLSPTDIYCFERNGRTTDIITVYGIYTIWNKLSELMEILPSEYFVRCHNSYIVYLPAVREMLADEFILNNDMKIMISRSYRKSTKIAFMRWAFTQSS